MVHALTESHRVLRRSGHVVDLHPEPGPRRPRRLPVYIVADGRVTPAGEWPADDNYDSYQASEAAVARVIRKGLFRLRESVTFPLRYHFRSLKALDDMLEKWADPELPVSLRSRLDGLLRAQPDAWIVAVEPFRLNVLRKT